MAAPATFHSVTSGSTTGTAGDITQFTASHPAAFARQGTSQVSYTAAHTGSQGTNQSGSEWLAQPFATAVGQTTISRIELYLGSTGTGADTTMQIRTNSSGNPSNTTVYSCVIPSDYMGTAFLSIPCNLTGLVAGTTYHIVLTGTAGSTNYANWYTAATSVNAGLKSASGTGAWTSVSATFLFNVFNGTSGVLRNVAEDGASLTTSGITAIANSPARWTGFDWTTSYSQNVTPPTYREYVGTVRTVRTLAYTSGQLTSVA